MSTGDLRRMIFVLCIIHKWRQLRRWLCFLSICSLPSIDEIQSAVYWTQNWKALALEMTILSMKTTFIPILLSLSLELSWECWIDNIAILEMCCKCYRFKLNAHGMCWQKYYLKYFQLGGDSRRDETTDISIIVKQILRRKFPLNRHFNQPKIAEMIVGSL